MRMRNWGWLLLAVAQLGMVGCGPEIPAASENIGTSPQALTSDGTWSDAATMRATRYAHAAVQLADGRVLVVGGTDKVAETAELYDADKKEWTLLDVPASNGTSSECRPGLAQLDNGMVVVVSTFSASGKLGTVSTFDPLTGSWKTLMPTLPIRTCRANVVPLENGRALILADDEESNQVLAFVFNSGKFDPITTPLPTPKVGSWKDAATIRLLDGRVLVSGGSGANLTERNGESIVYDPANPNVWTSVGELFFARSKHAVALLPSGNVLAVGGEAVGPFEDDWSNTAEIFDVQTMTWAPTTPMQNSRNGRHTATQLKTNFVLVVGGSISSTAELFDPSTDTWTPLENPDVAFFDHSATVLEDGPVLVTGGVLQSASNLATLCDALAFAWQPIAPIPVPGQDRGFHSATKLDNGNLLIVGGIVSNGDPSSTPALQDVWVYSPTVDPTVNPWSEQAQTASLYGYHTATKLLDGRVLVAGGIAGASAEIFDPLATTNPWQTATSLPKAIKRATATLLMDGRVLHVGGVYSTGTPLTVPDVLLYEPTSNEWTAGPDLIQGLHASRFGHTATLLDDNDGSVLVVGGCEMLAGDGNVDAPIAEAAVFNPKDDTWTSVASMSRGRAFHSATRLDDGRVLVAGGGRLSTFTDTKTTWDGVYSSAEIYDPVTMTWAPAESMVEARTEHEAVLLENGRVVISGGRKNSLGRTLASAEVFDPRERTWTATSRMQIPRYGHSLTLFDDGVVAVGGIRPFLLNESTAERFPQAKQGDPCTQNDQCKSKYCVDNVCCDTACNSPCLGCSIQKGASQDGTCEDVSGCAPFACAIETGTCGKTCTAVDECATGYVCDPSKVCVEPLKNASVVDDASCAASPAQSNAPPWPGLTLVACVFALRRHRGARKDQRKS